MLRWWGYTNITSSTWRIQVQVCLKTSSPSLWNQHFFLPWACLLFSRHRQVLWNATIVIRSSNNQRLRSAGDNDRRSKRFCSSAVLWVSFTWQMVKRRVISVRAIESPNTRDQITFCAFHSFLVKSKRMLATYMRNNSLGPVVRRLISALPGFLYLVFKSIFSDNFLCYI